VAATILIVEDEYAVARGSSTPLQQEGYQVAVSRSGEEGLEFALREGPDLVSWTFDCQASTASSSAPPADQRLEGPRA